MSESDTQNLSLSEEIEQFNGVGGGESSAATAGQSGAPSVVALSQLGGTNSSARVTSHHTPFPSESTILPTFFECLLDPEQVRTYKPLLTISELHDLKTLLKGQVTFDTQCSLGSIIDCHREDWIGLHLDSLKAPISFPFSPFLSAFLCHYGVLPGQICPNAHRILACFPQICARHKIPCSVELFSYLFSVRALPPKHGGGFLMIQDKGSTCSITHLPKNNKGWKRRFFSVNYKWQLPVLNVWSSKFRKHIYPTATPVLKAHAKAISVEYYDYQVFRTPEDYAASNLQEPQYDLKDKYVPKRKEVTITVPVLEVRSDARDMRLDEDFEARSTTPKAPRAKISLGAKKSRTPEAGPTILTGLPFTAINSAGATDDRPDTKAYSKRGKEPLGESGEEARDKRAKKESSPDHTPIIEALLSDLPPAALINKIAEAVPDTENTDEWSTDKIGEKGARNFIQMGCTLANLFIRTKASELMYQNDMDDLMKSIARKDAEIRDLEKKANAAEFKIITADYKALPSSLNDAIATPGRLASRIFDDPEVAEPFFRALLATKTGKEMVREYGQWAYLNGKKKMFDDVKDALAKSLKDDEFQMVLGVLPKEVTDPGPEPYTEPSPAMLPPAQKEIEREKSPTKE